MGCSAAHASAAGTVMAATVALTLSQASFVSPWARNPAARDQGDGFVPLVLLLLLLLLR
jgi:hypothetical protein